MLLPREHCLARIVVHAQLVHADRWPELRLVKVALRDLALQPVEVLNALIEETTGVRPGFNPRGEALVAGIVAMLLPPLQAELRALMGTRAATLGGWAVLAALPRPDSHLRELLQYAPDDGDELSLATWEWGLDFAARCPPRELDDHAARYCGESLRRLRPPADFARTRANLLRAAAAAADAVRVEFR